MSEWKLVPVEPTREMLDAGCEIDARAVALAELEAEYKQAGLTYPSAVVPAGRYLSVQYRAMLDAAPPPAADAVTDDEVMQALRRLWPLIERGTKGFVFTAEKAGEVAADMATLRAALAARGK